MTWRVVEVFGGLAPYCLDAMACEAERSGARAVRHEPPVSRMGNKAGFVRNIKRAFGLTRIRWSSVWMNDLDPVCHLFHLIYASAPLRDAVARRLWAWVPCPECLPHDVEAALAGFLRPSREWCKQKWATIHPAGRSCDECGGSGVQDARRLWERLRRAPVPGDLVDSCAAALIVQGQSVSACPILIEDEQWRMMRDQGNWSTCTFRSPVDDCGVVRGITSDSIASRVAALPAGLVDVASAAVYLQSRSFQLKPVSIAGGAWSEQGMVDENDGMPKTEVNHAGGWRSPRWTVAERVAALPGKWVENGYKPETDDKVYPCGSSPGSMAARHDVASRVSLLPGPGGCHIGVSRMDALEFVRGMVLGNKDVLVLDPPYEGTSGYQASSCRDAVLEIARIGHEAGALVLLHEACPLADALGDGWQSRPAGLLRARASTFWGEGGEREWLTFNRAPVWWPAIQQGLFT